MIRYVSNFVQLETGLGSDLGLVQRTSYAKLVDRRLCRPVGANQRLRRHCAGFSVAKSGPSQQRFDLDHVFALYTTVGSER